MNATPPPKARLLAVAATFEDNEKSVRRYLLILMLATTTAFANSQVLTLGEVRSAIVDLQLQRERQILARARLEASKAKLTAEKSTLLRFSSEYGLGYGASPQRDDSTYLSPPSTFRATQTYALTARRELYDFGEQAAKQELLRLESQSLPLVEDEAALGLHWLAAKLFLEARIQAATVKAMSAQLANAEKRHEALRLEYLKGLRSESDFVRADTDRLRNRLSLSRTKESFATAVQALAANMGHQGDLSLRISPFHERTVSGWQELFQRLDRESKHANTGSSLAEESSLERSHRQLALARLQGAKQVLSQRIRLLDLADRPQIYGEVGTRLPGELLPLQSQVFAQVNLQWDIPVEKASRYAREELLSDLQLLASDEAALLRLEEGSLRQTRLLTEQWLEQLQALADQRLALEKLLALSSQKFHNGTATSLELSSLEDELLTNTSEAIKAESQIYRQILNWAEARGKFSLISSLIDPREDNHD